MKNAESIKQTVKEKYSQIALEQGGCCGDTASCGCAEEISFIGEDYEQLEGYNSEADLGLGCGLPTQYAHIKAGDTVLDLGSGAGNDCFVARSLTGEQGRVIGVDMAEPMIELARQNAAKLGYTNMEFRLGEIEDLPLDDDSVDVVVSNCVLNLVPDKPKAFAETFRVLRPGGHFSISDVVVQGELPQNLKEKAELYVGCVAGAIDKDTYLEMVKASGFTEVQVQKLRKIELPEEVLAHFLDEAEIAQSKEVGIFSMTLYGKKPEQQNCCEPDCCG